jgi:HAD superfamily hydrolase (TIGR01490 family)
MPRLTLFDLDHTLIRVDSNQAWIRFLIDQGRLDRIRYSALAACMEERYRSQVVEIDIEFCEFFIQTLVGLDEDELSLLVAQFLEQAIRPAITSTARALVATHAHAGDTLAIITATNRVITAPIAREFGIEHLIATEPESRVGRLTGRISGMPAMRSGKVVRLEEWLASGALPGARSAGDLEVLRFYSDSINDRALLSYVKEAIAVDPDPALEALAALRGWPVISLA